MPWGLKRFYGGGDMHFITGGSYRRQAFLGSEQRRDLFLAVLEQVRQRYSFVVVGYVVMPEHFHLLLSEPEKGNPSVVMQALKLGFARRVLRPRCGGDRQADLWSEAKPAHVWQRRFYDYNVWSQHKRVEKLRYIHRNPVEARTGGEARAVVLEQLP
jgi:putative transposase